MADERFEGREEHVPGEPVYEPRERRPYYPERGEREQPSRRISWGAVFAGTVVALVTQLMLTLLGLGIGAATINPATEQQPFAGLGVGATIWFALTTIIALFAGGVVAARLTNIPRSADAILGGIVTWSLVFLVSTYFATSAIGSLLGGVTGVVGQGMTAVVEGATQGLTGAQQPGQALEQLGERAQSAAPQDVEIGAQAQRIGQQAASGLSAASFGAFIVLLLGLGAAVFGAWAGKPKRMLRDQVEAPATPTAH